MLAGPLRARRLLPAWRPAGVVIGESQRDAILFGLTEILTGHAQRIRRCAADDCMRIFLARKAQHYCGSSDAVSGRSMQRNRSSSRTRTGAMKRATASIGKTTATGARN
jgi:hypothetical protein